MRGAAFLGEEPSPLPVCLSTGTKTAQENNMNTPIRGLAFALSFAAALANAQVPCKPLETRKPNAEGQTPAFPGQTRACEVKSDVAYELTVLARGLEKPWAVEPL